MLALGDMGASTYAMGAFSGRAKGNRSHAGMSIASAGHMAEYRVQLMHGAVASPASGGQATRAFPTLRPEGDDHEQG